MINAELNHNPYLLKTDVKFNGQSPRINCQVEKYDKFMLKDWIDKVPQIFYDEMNGYDFDFHFTGTKSDFESLQKAFLDAGVSNDLVRLYHKNELEDAETKSCSIDNLIEWLKNTSNRNFDFEDFFAPHSELFESTYPYVIINGPAADEVHPEVSAEIVHDAISLKDTVLTNTPVMFFISPDSLKEFRIDLIDILNRQDIKQNQLFFLFHPQVNGEQVRRVICDLGVENPQIVSSYGDESVLAYLRNYPITEFVQKAIVVFREKVQQLSEILEEENEESAIQNAGIREEIRKVENQIKLLKDADSFFTERDNFNTGSEFSDLKKKLEEELRKWRNKKTKLVGESECTTAAVEYQTEIIKKLESLTINAGVVYQNIANKIQSDFKSQYAKQGMDLNFKPIGTALMNPVAGPSVSLLNDFMEMMVYEEQQQFDLIGWLHLPGGKNGKEEKKPVLAATCELAKWRKKSCEVVLPLVDDFIEKNIAQLSSYYNILAEAYHVHLQELLAEQEKERDKVSSQLSEEERKLQEDNNWLAKFKEQLEHIERD